MFLFVGQLLANIDIVIQKWEGKQHEFVEYLKKKHHVTSLSDLRQNVDMSAPPVKESVAEVKATMESVNEVTSTDTHMDTENNINVSEDDAVALMAIEAGIFKQQLEAFYEVHNPAVRSELSLSLSLSLSRFLVLSLSRFF